MHAHLKFVIIGNDLRRAVVNRHCTLRQPIILLQLSVHEKERLAGFGRAFLECLLKEVSSTLKFCSALFYSASGLANFYKKDRKRTYRFVNFAR